MENSNLNIRVKQNQLGGDIMTVVYCSREDCKFNKDKKCIKEEIHLSTPTYRALHIYCLDFEKKEDD